MQWIVALIILLAGLGGMFFLVRSGSAMKGHGGIAGSFLQGFAEVHDPTAAMIALENEKRANMEGEEDDGDPPDPSPTVH